MNKLQKLIRKSILEVLQENTTNPIKGTVNISSDDPDEQDKVNQATQSKQSYALYEEEIDEMARIATLIKLGDPNAVKASQQKYEGTWVGDLIDTVVANPNGITQPALAIAAGKSRQQDINPYINKLLNDGTFTKGDLEKPKQEKPESTGILGRPKTDDGIKKDTARSLMQQLRDNPTYEPSEEEIKVLGQEEIDKIKSLMVSGGIKRGRKIGSSTKSQSNLSEMARTATNYVINDESLLNDTERENKWVSGIIDYLNEKGSASTIDIAKNKFDRPQQSINMLISALVQRGVLSPEGERTNRKTFAKKQNTYYNEEVPDEFANEIDPDDNAPLSAEDYFIGNKLQSRMKAPVEPLEQDADGEPEIPANIKKDGPIHKPNISDEDYQDLMKFLDYKERIKKIDGNLRKSNSKSAIKKSDSTDLGSSRSGDENTRLVKLKLSLEQKLADLKANSPYIKSKLDRENNSMVAEAKRMQTLANING